jgi:hypothetical protein
MLRIESVKPTVLFKRSDDGLLQAVDVTIKNTSSSPSVGAEVSFEFPGRSPVVCKLDDVAPKTSTQRVMVPDLREPADVQVAQRGGVPDARIDRRTGGPVSVG